MINMLRNVFCLFSNKFWNCFIYLEMAYLVESRAKERKGEKVMWSLLYKIIKIRTKFLKMKKFDILL